jgi:hypothetical protein
MHRFALAGCVGLALLPGIALAQTDNSAPPPPPGDFDAGPGMMGGPGGGMMGNHKGHGWGGPEEFLIKFYAANTTHDGHLTLAQAKAAAFAPIVDHFNDIDVSHRGYITFYDIEAWHLDDVAKHLEQQADALRARD